MPTASSPPPDFHLTVEAGGNLPFSEFRTLEFSPSGLCVITDHPRAAGEAAQVRHLYLTPALMADLHRRLRRLGFSKVVSKDSGVRDGDRVRVALVAEGRQHEIVLRNVGDRRIDTFVRELNELLPDDAELFYNALDERIARARRRRRT